MSSICLDSSAWIEITHDRPNAATFAEALASTAPVIVPTICLYEIAGYTTRVAGQAATEELLTFIQQHTIAPISATLAATRRHFRSCSQTRHGGHHSLAILNRVLAGECLKGCGPDFLFCSLSAAANFLASCQNGASSLESMIQTPCKNPSWLSREVGRSNLRHPHLTLG